MSLSSQFRLRLRTDEIAVNMAARDSLLEEIRNRFLNRRGFALATINLDHLVKLRRGGAFREAYRAQDFVVADGNPIVWLSRLARRPVELIPGSDLVQPLAALAAQEGARVALVGATAPVLERAAARLKADNPGLEVVLTIAPSQNFDPNGAEADEIFAALRKSGATLTLIALGAPKQEVFAARGRTEAPSVGFASIGASLDFLAGSQTRAPRWVRRIAMEWAWRLALSPRRLAGRYMSCALILPELVLGALSESSAPVAEAGGETA